MNGTVIETSGLSKRFGQFTAVDQLSMRIREETVHGFLGPNGSGKTTAIRMMCGLLDPSEGEVQVLGMQVYQVAQRLASRYGKEAARGGRG